MSSEIEFSGTTEFNDALKNFKGASGYFAILTANKFMNGIEPSDIIHDQNIKDAVIFSQDNELENFMDLEETISDFTHLNTNDISINFTEDIESGNFKIQELFTKNKRNVVIFVKGYDYITIMYDGNTYYIRNCTKVAQYETKLYIYVYNFLCNVYKLVGFENDIISYINIKEKFNLISKEEDYRINDDVINYDSPDIEYEDFD